MTTMGAVKSTRIFPIFLLATAYTAIIAMLALNRDWMTYSTETDFLGGFVHEAQRFLTGQPMRLDFHPPFYSIIVASAYRVLDDWMKAAIVVSLLSTWLCLIFNFLLFRRSLGDLPGYAAVFATCASTVYFTFSGLATSDIFFFFLYSVALYCGVRSFQGYGLLPWFICGAVCGLVLLTRSNGLVLCLLAFLPVFVARGIRYKLSSCALYFIGLLLPLGLWGTYAAMTNSPFAPAGNHLNLALTYFADGSDRINGEARFALESRFTSLWSVISYNPLLMAKIYLRDLMAIKPLRSADLMYPALAVASVAALFYTLIRRKLSIVFCCLLGITIIHVLLINLKAFEPRYYLFILPVLTAPLGLVMSSVLRTRFGQRFKVIGTAGVIVLFITLVVNSILKSHTAYHKDDQEIESAVAQIKDYFEQNPSKVGTIYSRKPHIPWYTGVEGVWIPSFATLAEFQNYLYDTNNKLNDEIELVGNTQVLNNVKSNNLNCYIFYGKSERHFRPQYDGLLTKNPDFKVILIHPASAELEKSDWVLLRYVGRDK